jgi:hypothetical protein
MGRCRSASLGFSRLDEAAVSGFARWGRLSWGYGVGSSTHSQSQIHSSSEVVVVVVVVVGIPGYGPPTPATSFFVHTRAEPVTTASLGSGIRRGERRGWRDLIIAGAGLQRACPHRDREWIRAGYKIVIDDRQSMP